MFSANGIRPWHGLGAVIEDAPATEDAIRIAKLNWSVRKERLYYKRSGLMTAIPDRYGLVRQDNGRCLGVVQNRYEIIQNIEAFSFVDDIMRSESGAVHYETAGSLYGGKKIYLLVRLPDCDMVGDKIESYLFFTNSHDGIHAVKAGISSVRVVCDNTLQMAVKGAVRLWSAHHTKSVKARCDEAARTLGLAERYLKEMAVEADKMAAARITIKDFTDMLFTREQKEKPAAVEAVKRITALAEGKEDLIDFRGTAWGAYNAVADYVSHPLKNQRFRNEDRKVDSFFSGSTLLNRAQKILSAA